MDRCQSRVFRNSGIVEQKWGPRKVIIVFNKWAINEQIQRMGTSERVTEIA
jgi:hypothetical protein